MYEDDAYLDLPENVPQNFTMCETDLEVLVGGCGGDKAEAAETSRDIVWKRYITHSPHLGYQLAVILSKSVFLYKKVKLCADEGECVGIFSRHNIQSL